ncbi:hypothetical protein [Burkholderia pseudomallei]|uniref:hypothetical protein n=1 Tax=Burkholderia pseudomallei TaxID=28450 RepID=UPI0018AC953F|nr:hypothetical protein [Burkholderia pseudomallei]
MLIRKQGRLVKLLRVEPPRGSTTVARARQGGSGRRHVIGSFRVDEPVPSGLLAALTREERRTLACWLTVYREDQARVRALPILAEAPEQFEAIIAALEAAADALSVEEADRLWFQLKAIERTLKRAGHARPRRARRAPVAHPGQRDFFGEIEAIKSRAVQRESVVLE